jgi:hypothetical protein
VTTEECIKFNDRIIDSPDVRYFSISGARPWHRMAPIFLHSQKIISNLEGPNDGMVSVGSAMWGEHLHTWPCDHLHMVNRRLVPKIATRTGDVCVRYVELLKSLEDAGCMDLQGQRA